MREKNIQIIGPYITNFSLARVNRGLATALRDIQLKYDVEVAQFPEKLDKIPDENDYARLPHMRALVAPEPRESDVFIYNDFPKVGYVSHGIDSLPGKVKIMYIAWEETVYPRKWVEEINQFAHGVMAATSFVRDVLRKSGVKVPIEVVWNAIDDGMVQGTGEKYPLRTKKKVKFLHVSSARMRKGIDVLLKAYFAAFTDEDDVCLVIKSFPGPDNMVNELLHELRDKHSNPPEVEHIFDPDIPDKRLVDLLKSCDVAVYPSRAEGFGLPILEAMYHGVPAIATNYSGYLDFVTEDSAYLLDYELVPTTQSEQVNLGAKWAEPDEEQLHEYLQQLYWVHTEVPAKKTPEVPETTEFVESLERYKREMIDKVSAARKRAKSMLWRESAADALRFIEELETIATLKEKNIGVVSFFNSEDGISEYVRDLYMPIEKAFNNCFFLSNKDIHDRVYPDKQNVIRCWESGDTEFQELLQTVQKHAISLVHIQYHSGINFPVQGLNALLRKLDENNIDTFVTLHAVRGSKFDVTQEITELHRAKEVMIHNEKDVKYVLQKTKAKTRYEPHPKITFAPIPKSVIKRHLGMDEIGPIIITHGMMTDQKADFISMLDAISMLQGDYPNILYIAANAVSANNATAGATYEKMQERIKEKGLSAHVRIIPEFLTVAQIQTLLQMSDIGLMPYFDVGESSSGALGKFLAAELPTIVTDIPMFSEVQREVLRIPNTNPDVIARNIGMILREKPIQYALRESIKQFVRWNTYEHFGRRMLLRYAGDFKDFSAAKAFSIRDYVPRTPFSLQEVQRMP